MANIKVDPIEKQLIIMPPYNNFLSYDLKYNNKKPIEYDTLTIVYFLFNSSFFLYCIMGGEG